MKTLDQQISDAFGLLGVLLVFVIAYFSALLPQIDELLERATPVETDPRAALAGRLAAYRKLAVGFLALIVLVGLVLYPLTDQVVRKWSFHWPFPTLRIGLVLVAVCLVGMFGSGIRLIQRLSTRIRTLRTPPPTPAPAPIS